MRHMRAPVCWCCRAATVPHQTGADTTIFIVSNLAEYASRWLSMHQSPPSCAAVVANTDPGDDSTLCACGCAFLGESPHVRLPQDEARSQYPAAESQLKTELEAAERKLRALRALAPVDARLQACLCMRQALVSGDFAWQQ